MGCTLRRCLHDTLVPHDAVIEHWFEFHGLPPVLLGQLDQTAMLDRGLGRREPGEQL